MPSRRTSKSSLGPRTGQVTASQTLADVQRAKAAGADVGPSVAAPEAAPEVPAQTVHAPVRGRSAQMDEVASKASRSPRFSFEAAATAVHEVMGRVKDKL